MRTALGGLGVNLNVGYHDSEIKETALRPAIAANYYFNGSPAFNLDPRGLRLNFDPEWTYNIGLDYTINVGSDGTLTPYVQYSFVDEQWTQLTQASQDFIPSREVVDFRLVYQHDERWRVEGYVTNALDERYVAGIAGGPTATPYYASVALGAPREFGVKVKYAY
jgi:outer membrane receptor protein involved in Fe transport